MGFSPRQIDEFSIWEFAVASQAYGKANGWSDKSGGGEVMSEDDMRKLGIITDG